MAEAGFFATVFAFIGVVAVSWWFLIPLLLTIVWTTHYEADGWTFILLAVLAATLVFFWQIPWATVAYGAAAYIPLGIGWSLLRWRRFCKKKYEETKEKMAVAEAEIKESSQFHNSPDFYKKEYIREIAPGENIGRIVWWVFIWPFSLIDNIIGDIIDLVTDFIKKYLIKIYETIAYSYIKKL